SNGYVKRDRKAGKRTDFTKDPEIMARRQQALARVGCCRVSPALKAKAEGVPLERTRSGCANPTS
ncbi:hypothetical protein ACG3QR_33215, partial [Pseudomonas aeruginosa]